MLRASADHLLSQVIFVESTAIQMVAQTVLLWSLSCGVRGTRQVFYMSKSIRIFGRSAVYSNACMKVVLM